MFWGLIMEPQRRYTQKVKKSFHISMASLDISTSTDEPAQVMCGFEGRNYLLCTLRKPDLLQCALDLNFEVGDELSLAANGKCHVHLTGYLTEDFDEEDDENEVDEDVEEEEEVEVEEKQKKKSKRNKKEVQNGPPAKKSKVANSDDEESDTDIRAFLKKSLVETDEDDVTFTSEDEAADEEEDNDDDDESEDLEEEEEVESSLSDGDSDEKEVEEPPKQKSKKNKQNGLPNKQEKPEQTTPKQKEKEKKKKEQTETKSPQKDQSPLKKKILQGGVVIEEIREGQGLSAKPGKYISVLYEGRLKHNNKLFDSTTKGSGFSFRLGTGEVIKGWDVGVVGMKIGGKRRITCPPSMAYGAKGSPPAIPGNSVLVFEVELKKVR